MNYKGPASELGLTVTLPKGIKAFFGVKWDGIIQQYRFQEPLSNKINGICVSYASSIKRRMEDREK